MNETDAAVHQPKRPRSPSYPAISLPQALDRAKSLYRAESRNTAPIQAILQHWNYSPGSGAGMVTVAALKKFGLLADEGSGAQRKARLTNLAFKIILDEREGSPEREEAIKQAALSPSIHKELWEKYPDGLPSDATLRHFLRFERGFTDGAADELIKEFRDTVSFANLTSSDSLSDENEDTDEQDDEQNLDMTGMLLDAPGGAKPRAVQLPLSANEWVTIQAAFPLSASAWDQMIRVLDVMKPGLVAPDQADPSD